MKFSLSIRSNQENSELLAAHGIPNPNEGSRWLNIIEGEIVEPRRGVGTVSPNIMPRILSSLLHLNCLKVILQTLIFLISLLRKRKMKLHLQSVVCRKLSNRDVFIFCKGIKPWVLVLHNIIIPKVRPKKDSKSISNLAVSNSSKQITKF